MDSRVDKYYDKSTENIGSRTARNNQLYKEINNTVLESYPVRSNATVIGNNKSNIDVEKIKSILDTHYNDAPKRRSIRIEKSENNIPVENDHFETKEYDINVILDKAKENKNGDYEEDRARKLRDTQYDILSNLNINPKDYIEDYEEEDSSHTKDNYEDNKEATKKELENLINTISLNEKEIKSKTDVSSDTSDPLDIFEDLKGDDKTAVLDGLQEKTENMIEKIEQTTALDNTFFTKSNQFKKKDFEDFEDLQEDGSGVFIKILIVLLIAAFVVGIYLLVKSFI